MYELCTLRPAFTAFNMEGLMNKIIKGAAPPLPAAFSEDWREAMRRMLAKSPAERPTAAELLRVRCCRSNTRALGEKRTGERWVGGSFCAACR